MPKRKNSLPVIVGFLLSMAASVLSGCAMREVVTMEESKVIAEAQRANETAALDSEEILADYMDKKLPPPAIEELHLIGEDLCAEQFEEKNCAVVYCDQGAWLFDYERSIITPLTDIDRMLTEADPTDQCRPYFENVALTYEFAEFDDSILITFHIVSIDSEESRISMHSWLHTTEEPYSPRGRMSSFSIRDLAYPGSDEPLVIHSIDELDKLYPEIRPDDTFVQLITSWIPNDIPALEALLGLEQGTLSIWEGTVISDCAILREMPLNRSGFYSMEFTIEKSTVERYPEGRYQLNSSSSRLPGAYDIQRLDGEEFAYSLPDEVDEDAIRWALSWGTRYGGCMVQEKQNPAEPGFAHVMLDYLLTIAAENGVDGTEFTGNLYREYAEKYLSLTGFENSYTAYGDRPIDHGGHGPNIVYGEVAGYRFENGVHYVTINSYADPFLSVVGRTHTYGMVETENHVYAVVSTEFVYDAGLGLMGWAV